MAKYLYDLEQGSEEWLKARAGIPTASNFSKILTNGLKSSKSKRDYMLSVVFEKIAKAKDSADNYKSSLMQRGNDLEEEAKISYGITNDVLVKDVGIVLRDDGEVGASPDGLVGDDGIIEIKCVLGSTLLSELETSTFSKYLLQIQGNLWITERKWCDLIIYHPQVKLFTVRIFRDEEKIKAIESHVNRFIVDCEKMFKKYSYLMIDDCKL